MNRSQLDPPTARRQPCCVSVSVETRRGMGQAVRVAFRRWRALSLDRREELAAGEFETNLDEPLSVARDRATSAARERGYDPQQFVLEKYEPAA